MAYDLNNLWDKTSSVTYLTLEEEYTSNASSIEKNAQFLVRWAAEVFSTWGIWMQYLLPGCKVSHKKSVLRIVN